MTPQCAMRKLRFIRVTFAPLMVMRPLANQLRQEVDQVVQDHEAERHRDQGPVRPADPLHDGMRGAGRGLHVDRTDVELGFVDALVTCSAGLGAGWRN